jgi:predicted GNAT family N-acyltransferase
MKPPAPPGDLRIRLGSWEQLGTQAREIRLDVFVEEQGVPAQLEFDRFDPVCVHALVLEPSGRAVGTGRLMPDARIGRIAVRKDARAMGVGACLLQHLMDAARRRGDRRIELSSQIQVQDFYRRFGFVPVGEPYDDAGIVHLAMRAELPPPD